MATDLKIPAQGSRFVQAESIQQTEPGILEFSFASTKPVQQSFGFTEILDLSGIDTSRVDSGVCALLLNHDPSLILGRVLAVWRVSNTLRCRCELGTTPTALQYGPDILAGLLRGVSCRYTLDSYRQSVGPDGEQVVTVSQWELLEITIASVPADSSVGVGRSCFTEGKVMPTQERAAREKERSRIRIVNAMVEKYAPRISGGMARAIEIGESCIDGEMTEEQARSMFADEILGSQQPIESARRPQPQSDGRPPGMAQRGAILGLGQKDIEAYSISRLISAVQSNNWQNAGLELECSRALQGKGFDGQNLIPVEALRVFNVQTSQAQAGALVGVEHHGESFIDALRAKTFAYELGAMRMDGLMGNIEIPRKTGVSSLGWVGEDVDLPESGPSFDKLNLRPRTVGAFCQLTRMLSVQSDPQVEQLILRDFAASLAREIDRTAVHGNGTTEPLGILNQPGVSSVALGTNGGLFTWDSIVALEGKVSDLNADSGSLGYVTSTRVKSKLKTSLKSATAGAEYIWMDSPQMNGEGMLNGYRAMASSTVRTDLTKGTGTNLSAAIFGNWSDLIIATWGVLDLQMNPYANFKSGRTEARLMLFADMAVRHAASFAVATDAITT